MVMNAPGKGLSGTVRFVMAVVVCVMMFATLLVLVLPLVESENVEHSVPVGTYFEYEYEQGVKNGKGAYAGYDEDTEGDGRYEVTQWGPEEARMSYSYTWSYDNNEGKKDSGGRDGDLSFNISSRYYTSSPIDLDDVEYQGIPYDSMCQWLWVPPDVKEGDVLHILNNDWTVTGTDVTIWSNLIPRRLIEVTVSGDAHRNDDYGNFDYDYTDRMYFDKDTGMFFAERYTEHDVGYWEGDGFGSGREYAEFDMYIDIDVTDSSYSVEINWGWFLGVYLSITFGTFLLVSLIVFVVYKVRWRTRIRVVDGLAEDLGDTTFQSSDRVTIRRIKKVEDLPHRRNNTSAYFGPFLEHWVEKALLAGDRVAVAVGSHYGLLGIAIYNKESKIGTVLSKNAELTEVLRKFIGCKDFFTEVRHKIRPNSDMRQDLTVMSRMSRVDYNAYNVFETQTVYRLDPIRPKRYDHKLVRPIADKDLPEVIGLARKIFKERSKKWVSSCMGAGDLGFVAEQDGRIVGFGFACVCEEHGRLHTLGVDPEYRGKGIAKELHRARLEAMRRMGVEDVIDEIADWNLASVRVSTMNGFKPIGKIYVETIRTKRIKKNLVRR